MAVAKFRASGVYIQHYFAETMSSIENLWEETATSIANYCRIIFLIEIISSDELYAYIIIFYDQHNKISFYLGKQIKAF